MLRRTLKGALEGSVKGLKGTLKGAPKPYTATCPGILPYSGDGCSIGTQEGK